MPSLRAAVLVALIVLVLYAGGSDAAGDARRGELIYGRCLACHSLDRNRTGPRHCGLFGRRAGSLPDFAYSSAMRRSGFLWNEATLDRFLADPIGTVPGTAMGYAGIDSPQDRADLIAYLKYASSSPLHCR